MTDWRDKFLLALIILLPVGCAAMMTLDPVQTPPAQYRRDVTATVEFVAPELVASRCLIRGSGILANACADQSRITLPNPCAFSDAYAKIACHEMGHANGWDAAHTPPLPLASESPQALAITRGTQ
jgi:hypothetical protein